MKAITPIAGLVLVLFLPHTNFAANERQDAVEIQLEPGQSGFLPPKQLRPVVAELPISIDHLEIREPEVRAKVQVDESGKVTDYVIIEASHPAMISPAITALKRIQMEPAKDDGKPVAVVIDVQIPFNRDPVASRSVVHDLMRYSEPEITEPLFTATPASQLDSRLEVRRQGQVYAPGDGSESGEAVVEFYIDHDGQVRLPRVVSSSDEEAALAAVMTFKEFRFAPPRKGNKPTVVKVRMPYKWAPATDTTAGS